MQTFRTNNILILTTPDSNFIDKIAMTLINYRVLMSLNFFNKGITLGKLSYVSKISTKDSSNNIYPFLRAYGVVFNYIQFKLPPKPLRDAYKMRRKSVEREMNLRCIAEMEEKAAKREEKKIKEENKIKIKKLIILLEKQMQCCINSI
jgi:hypothetical protein